jgi:hypothetical protein
VCVRESQPRESGEVDGGGEEAEVGGDAQGAAHAGAASAMAAPDEMGELAFDLGTGGLVVAFHAWSRWRVRAAVRRAS